MDNILIINAKMPKTHLLFQLLRCYNVLFFLILYELYEVNIFRLWTAKTKHLVTSKCSSGNCDGHDLQTN